MPQSNNKCDPISGTPVSVADPTQLLDDNVDMPNWIIDAETSNRNCDVEEGHNVREGHNDNVEKQDQTDSTTVEPNTVTNMNMVRKTLNFRKPLTDVISA